MSSENEVETLLKEIKQTREWIEELSDSAPAKADQLIETAHLHAVMETGRSRTEVESALQNEGHPQRGRVLAHMLAYLISKRRRQRYSKHMEVNR